MLTKTQVLDLKYGNLALKIKNQISRELLEDVSQRDFEISHNNWKLNCEQLEELSKYIESWLSLYEWELKAIYTNESEPGIIKVIIE